MSTVIDQWKGDWQKGYIERYIEPLRPYVGYPDPILNQGEREKLKKEIEEFRKILKKAREWDKAHSSDPCTETQDKIDALMEIVRALGLEEEVEIVLKEVIEDDDSPEPADITQGHSTTITTGRINSVSVGGPPDVSGAGHVRFADPYDS